MHHHHHRGHFSAAIHWAHQQEQHQQEGHWGQLHQQLQQGLVGDLQTIPVKNFVNEEIQNREKKMSEQYRMSGRSELSIGRESGQY
ncbi:unnamed protein product [Caenorhabditis nigoni]